MALYPSQDSSWFPTFFATSGLNDIKKFIMFFCMLECLSISSAHSSMSWKNLHQSFIKVLKRLNGIFYTCHPDRREDNWFSLGQNSSFIEQN